MTYRRRYRIIGGRDRELSRDAVSGANGPSPSVSAMGHRVLARPSRRPEADRRAQTQPAGAGASSRVASNRSGTRHDLERVHGLPGRLTVTDHTPP